MNQTTTNPAHMMPTTSESTPTATPCQPDTAASTTAAQPAAEMHPALSPSATLTEIEEERRALTKRFNTLALNLSRAALELSVLLESFHDDGKHTITISKYIAVQLITAVQIATYEVNDELDTLIFEDFCLLDPAPELIDEAARLRDELNRARAEQKEQTSEIEELEKRAQYCGLFHDLYEDLCLRLTSGCNLESVLAAHHEFRARISK